MESQKRKLYKDTEMKGTAKRKVSKSRSPNKDTKGKFKK